MSPRSGSCSARAAAAALALLAIAGCGPRTHVAPIQRPDEDAFNVITSFEIRDGQALNRQETPLPAGAYRFAWFVRQGPGLRPLPGPHEKIHPALAQRLALGASSATEDVVVTFEDTLRVPRFSTLSGWAGFSPADSSAKRDTAAMLAGQLLTTRSIQRAADSAAVGARFSATVLPLSFWLTRSLVIRVPRDSIPALAASSGVVYVRPHGPTEPPPQMNSSELDNPKRVRWWVGADSYASPELQGGRIALLDTGVDFGHELLAEAGQSARSLDEVQRAPSGAARVLGTNSDVSPDEGHGTMSAGIIAGRRSGDEISRGLTKIPIDSYRIYDLAHSNTSTPTGLPKPGLVASALEHALESTLLSFGGVIVVEAQGEEPQDGGISLAADKAFDGGAVIIAANGNIETGVAAPKVRAPANARNALGIGAYSVRYGDASVEQIPGPANDLRTKPDLTAPTGYETASRGDYSAYAGYSGTSGATAVAGGAAALFRNLLLDDDASVDPGFVYAGLIATAITPVPYDPNVSGAGRLWLPNKCWYWMVKLSLSHGEYSSVALDASTLPLTRVVSGIWWPERAKWVDGVLMDTHSEIALTLKAADAGESPHAIGEIKESVFQRAGFQVAAPVTGLTARVHARTVRDGPQTVYLVVVGYGTP